MRNKYTRQIQKETYDTSSYESKERWFSYVTQVQETLIFLKKINGINVVEVGVGSKIFSAVLNAKKKKVTTVDIDPELMPDYVASVTELPFKNNQFDLAVAFEVLEHIKFADFRQAISELTRISKYGVIISIPDVRPYVSFSIKIPLINTFSFVGTVPVSLKKDSFDGEHYWEIGRKNYPKRRIMRVLKSFKRIKCGKEFRVAGCPFHHFFILEKSC